MQVICWQSFGLVPVGLPQTMLCNHAWACIMLYNTHFPVAVHIRDSWEITSNDADALENTRLLCVVIALFYATLLTYRSIFFCIFQNGQQLYRHIYLGCKEEDNVQKNYELLYTSLALITIELANEEVVIDLIRLAIALQVCFITFH